MPELTDTERIARLERVVAWLTMHTHALEHHQTPDARGIVADVRQEADA